MSETYLVVDGASGRWKVRNFTWLRVEKNLGADADEFRAELPFDDEVLERLKELRGETVRIHWNGTHIFSGLVDEVGYIFSAIAGRKVSLVGRDFTGFLIDKELSEGLANRLRGRTAGGAVSLVAGEFGYGVDVMDGTGVHRDLFHQGVPVWGVVRDLAEREGADAWVDKDKVIHFTKIEPGDPARVWIWPTSRITRLAFRQELTGMMGLKVVVEGYDPRSKKTIRATATTPDSQRNQIAEITVRNGNITTPQEARAAAETKLKELSERFITCEAVLPEADPALEVGDTVQIEGVGWLSGRFVVSGLVFSATARGEEFTVKLRSQTLAQAEVSHE